MIIITPRLFISLYNLWLYYVDTNIRRISRVLIIITIANLIPTKSVDFQVFKLSFGIVNVSPKIFRRSYQNLRR